MIRRGSNETAHSEMALAFVHLLQSELEKHRPFERLQNIYQIKNILNIFFNVHHIQ